MTQAQDKLKTGWERLKKAENEPDLLGLALISIHGALEDYFRAYLEPRANVSHQVQWKDLLDLMQQYGSLSSDERRRILYMNKLRQESAHGGEFKGSYGEVKDYAEYVQNRIKGVYSSNTVANNRQASSKYSSSQSVNSRAYSLSADRVMRQYYKLGLLPQWVIVNFTGIFLGWISGVIIYGVLTGVKVISQDFGIFLMIIWLLFVIGFAQQTVVERLFSSLSQFWAISTVGGGLLACIFGYILVMAISFLLKQNPAITNLLQHNQVIPYNLSSQAMQAIVVGVMGLNIGFFQFLILRKETKRANLWLVANAIQGGSYPLGFAILPSIFDLKNPFFGMFMLAFVLPSLCTAVTGIFLIYLFPYSRSRAR
jgi:hypothetical protein